MPDTVLDTCRSSPWQLPIRVASFWLVIAAMFYAVGVTSAALSHPWNRLAMGVGATLAAIAITVAFTWRRGPALTELGVALRGRSFIRGMIGAAIGAGMLGVHLGIVATLGGDLRLERVPEVSMKAATILALAYLALSAMEEVAFRGYPLRLLYRRYGLWVAQTVVAMAFIVYHIAGGQGWLSSIVGTGLGSLLFGMAAIATRGLAVPIGLHAAWNYGAWMIGDKQDPGPWQVVIPETSIAQVQLVGSISYVLVLGSATWVFWRWHRRNVRTDR